MISLELISLFLLSLQYVSQLYNMYLLVCLNRGSGTLLSTFLMAFYLYFSCIYVFLSLNCNKQINTSLTNIGCNLFWSLYALVIGFLDKGSGGTTS